MEVVNARAALLSNYEVLTLLRELESDHLARTKAAIRIKKEEEATQIQNSTQIIPGNNPQLEVSENLRTMEVEAIQYLSADYLPAKSQTDEGITQLLKDLAPYDLTKAEKLQIVNLAPTMPVELYVIVEEVEDRFGQRMDEILTHVKSSQTALAQPAVNGLTLNMEEIMYEGNENQEWGYEDVEAVIDEGDFDDTGEGAGVEGDLDMEED